MPFTRTLDRNLAALDAQQVLDDTLQEAARPLRRALERGTPVDSGAMRTSWVIDRGPPVVVSNEQRYARFVDIDDREALQVLEETDRAVVAAVNESLGGNGG